MTSASVDFATVRPTAPRSNLPSPESRDLVCLGMRPQTQVVLRRIIRRPLQVALHDVNVDDERRGIEIGDAHYF